MYEEYYITLPGGFQLPLALAVETYTFYETAVSEEDPVEAETALSAFAQDYLTGRMVAGRILSARQYVSLEDGVYRLTGSYICHEMIGRVQRE